MRAIRRKIRPVVKERQASCEGAVSKVVQAEFLRFIEYHPAGRVNRNLRRMLLEFMMTDAACESFYLKDLLYDLDGLFDLLDVLEREG